ncbi:MAG: LacI family DNA-binding transcriptional regulator [Bryobacteraceae bacterium]
MISRSPGTSKTSRRKAPNIYDVAREARVSVFTVSAVINKKEHVGAVLKRRVDAAISKLDYRPNSLAQSLAKERTHTIGIVVPDIANPFFPLLVRGAEDAAQKGGYTVLLCNSDGKPEKEELYLELLLSKRVDGILLTKAPGQLSPRIRRIIAEMKVPSVLMMRTYPSLTADAVITDDLKGSFEAVSHLARIGHRRIALVGGPLTVSNGKARWQGFRKALKANRLQYDPELIYEGDYHIESGRRAALSILTHRPDAVFIANYMMTVGFLQAAQEMGMRCPEDFGLVTLDDYPWLRLFDPPLTAVELPKYEVGCVATEMLLARIGGNNGRGVTRKIMPQLCIRESCGFRLQSRDSSPANAFAAGQPETDKTRSTRTERGQIPDDITGQRGRTRA